jgi:hypothetical protein
MDEVHVNGRCGEAVRHQSLGTRSISSQSDCKNDADLPVGPCISPRDIPAHASGNGGVSRFGNSPKCISVHRFDIPPRIDDAFDGDCTTWGNSPSVFNRLLLQILKFGS